MATKAKQKYRALTGLDYPPDRRVEIGEIVDDIPVMSVGWLLEQGLIEPVSEDATPAQPAPAEGGSDGTAGL